MTKPDRKDMLVDEADCSHEPISDRRPIVGANGLIYVVCLRCGAAENYWQRQHRNIILRAMEEQVAEVLASSRAPRFQDGDVHESRHAGEADESVRGEWG